MDITDAASVKANLMQIYKTEGRIDCLVNNAGIVTEEDITLVPFLEKTEKAFSKTTIQKTWQRKSTSLLRMKNLEKK